MNIFGKRWAVGLALACAAVGSAQASYEYNFSMPDGGYLIFLRDALIPIGLTGLNENLNTAGGSGQLAFTEASAYGFQNVVATFGNGTTSPLYVGYEVDMSPLALPAAAGQFAINTFTLTALVNQQFQQSVLNGGTLTIQQIAAPGPLPPVPEPSAWMLMAFGLGGLALARRRLRIG